VQSILAKYRGAWVVNVDCIFSKGMKIINPAYGKGSKQEQEEATRELEEYVAAARDDITYLLTHQCNDAGGDLVDVDLQPGRLGIDFEIGMHGVTNVVRTVQPGGQAYEKGVEHGWEMVGIEGRDPSLEHLKSLTQGSQGFTVTFKTCATGIWLYGSGRGFGPFVLDELDRVMYVIEMIMRAGQANRVTTWLMADNPEAPPGKFLELAKLGRDKIKGMFVCGGEPDPRMQVAIHQFCTACPFALYSGRSAGSILAGSAIHCTREGLMGEDCDGILPSAVIPHDPGSNEKERRHIAEMKAWAAKKGRPLVVLPDGEVFYEALR